MMDDYPEFYPDPQSDARAQGGCFDMTWPNEWSEQQIAAMRARAQSVSPAGYSSGVQLSEMTALLDQIHVLREKLDTANAIIAAMTAKAVPSVAPEFPNRALFCQRMSVGIRG